MNLFNFCPNCGKKLPEWKGNMFRRQAVRCSSCKTIYVYEDRYFNLPAYIEEGTKEEYEDITGDYSLEKFDKEIDILFEKEVKIEDNI